MTRERALAQLVVAKDQIVANAIRLHQMAQGSETEQKFHRGRVKNGKVFIALKTANAWIFAPSKFCGYVDNDTFHLDLLEERHGPDTNRRISSLIGEPTYEGMSGYRELISRYRTYCLEHNFEPSNHSRKPRFWIISESSFLVDEYPSDKAFYEGALKKVYINRYERDPEARRICLNVHGYDCSICETNFERRYGEIGRDFIHVHHIVPLSEIRKKYKIDPVNDLIPVCPNCHAMLHRTGDVLLPSQLKELLSKQAK